MNVKSIQSCHLGPEISPEQFISDHFFLYILEGSMTAWDGMHTYTIQPGEYCIARKNHLVRYTKQKENNVFRKIVITLDEPFLQSYIKKHPAETSASDNSLALIEGVPHPLIENYIHSLHPYYNGNDEIDTAFADLKREELVLILLKIMPELQNILLHFSIPQRIDLTEFMNRNFRFKVGLDRFAFLTGRSLSTFKRDFRKTFGANPGTWLTRKRLDEAYFLIHNHNSRPGDIYLDLGFEDFSHFTFAFRKQFGFTPTELLAHQQQDQQKSPQKKPA